MPYFMFDDSLVAEDEEEQPEREKNDDHHIDLADVAEEEVVGANV